MTETDWNECVPFTGPEKDLPLGIIITRPDIRIEDLIVEFITTKDGKPYDVVLNEDLIKNLDSDIVIKDAEGKSVTREEFFNAHGQKDAIKGLALRNEYLRSRGGGVHLYPKYHL